MTPRDMVARYLEADLDKDGKLSMKDEVPKMERTIPTAFCHG